MHLRHLVERMMKRMTGVIAPHSRGEYCLFNRSLLQKRPIVLRSLLIDDILNDGSDMAWLRLVGSLKL